ncbi:hypothetical protein [Rhodanobacter lindaniclasticus]
MTRLQQLVDWPRAMTPLQRWQQAAELTREPVPRAESIDCDEVWQTVCLLQPDSERQPAALVARLILLPDAEALQRPEEWVCGRIDTGAATPVASGHSVASPAGQDAKAARGEQAGTRAAGTTRRRFVERISAGRHLP